jgi:hypothetical protein
MSDLTPLRPFTAKWHPIAEKKGFEDSKMKQKFREELGIIQGKLRVYTKMLAELEDI